jgi:hypothetical protein
MGDITDGKNTTLSSCRNQILVLVLVLVLVLMLLYGDILRWRLGFASKYRSQVLS